MELVNELDAHIQRIRSQLGEPEEEEEEEETNDKQQPTDIVESDNSFIVMASVGALVIGALTFAFIKLRRN